MTRALMRLLYRRWSFTPVRFYQSGNGAGRKSSPSSVYSRGRSEPVAQGVGTVLDGDEEGCGDDRILCGGRRETGIGVQEPAEVGYTFEAPPGVDAAGLEYPVRHAGDFLGLAPTGAPRNFQVGHLREDLQVGLDQGAAYGVCAGEG